MEYPLMPFSFYTLHRPDMFPHLMNDRPPKMYQRYKDVLRILTWQSPEFPQNAGLRWTLKAPNHLLYIKQLVEAFQDARIVWTHRSAAKALPSWCSFVRTLSDASLAERLDLKMLGDVTLKDFQKVLKRAIDELEDATRKQDVKVSHVLYEDLVRDPIAVVRKLYEEFGYDFTPEFERRLEDYLEKNKKERKAMKASQKSIHAYSPETFGVSTEDVLREWEWYHKRFGIPTK
eukprot:scaffold2771_cov252-Pinguiococcus_pyrenoidosus.AAC.41